jgi:hypothetical protein
MTNIAPLRWAVRDTFAVVLHDPETQESMKFDGLSEKEVPVLHKDAKLSGVRVVQTLAPIRYFN